MISKSLCLLLMSLVAYSISADSALNQSVLSQQTDNILLKEAEIAYLRGEYKEAYSHYKTALNGLDRDTPGFFVDYYWMGKSLLALGRFKEARDVFQGLMDQHEDTQMQGYGRYAYGETFFYNNQFKKAEKEYKLVLDNADTVSSEDLRAMALYRLGIIKDCLGKEQGALRYFDQLQTEFPGTYAANDVKVSYFVQLGAFRNKGNAQRLNDVFLKKGYPSYIDGTGEGDKRFYRVRIGRYLTMHRATLALRDLKKKEKVDATLMKESR